MEKHEAATLGDVPESIDVDLKRRLGRYRADAVDEALADLRASYAELSDSSTRLREENDALLEEIEDLAEELEGYKAREQSVSDALVRGEKTAAELREKAELQSQEILARARKQEKEFRSAAKQDRARLEEEIRQLQAAKEQMLEEYRLFLLDALKVVNREKKRKVGAESSPEVEQESPASEDSDSRE